MEPVGPYIFDGEYPEENKYPYQVAIVPRLNKDFAHCGGVIINSEWILTAAHCFDNVKRDDFLIYSDNDKLNGNGTYHEILEIFPFDFVNPENGKDEKYDSSGYNHDILLIQLKKPLTLNSGRLSIQTISANELDIVIQKKEKVAMVGWGKTGNFMRPQRLVRKYLPLTDYKSCKKNKNLQEILYDGMICIGDKNDVSACRGDSGGGVFYESKNGTKLVGIIAIGSDQCNSNPKHLEYDVLMSIIFYKDWVDSIIELHSLYKDIDV